MRSCTSTALTLLAYSSGTVAWGTSGHATVALIADNYLTPTAKTWVSNILGSGVTMASVASEPDSYRYTSAGSFSRPFHFIDANDSPPTSCSVDLSRDCASGGCIVSAIANYVISPTTSDFRVIRGSTDTSMKTTQVQDKTATAAARKQYLEFLIHFFGDITQPLHDEALKLGGNDIVTTWNGATTNLHHCWDTQMVEKAAGGATVAEYTAWAKTLISQIDNGTYSSQKASWIACSNIATASACALSWAQDANAINCKYVLLHDETNQELSGSYYTGAHPIIEVQIAKGGYRLAAWLNKLAKS